MNSHEVKLHLGCGDRFIPGFIHIDIVPGEFIDYSHDIQTLPMFENEEVDLIYASHVLAYFDWVEVIDVLREWHRVLKTNGTLRLATPDFDALIELYREHGIAPLLGSLYGRIEAGDRLLYHHMVYNYSSLSLALRLVGFRNIRPWDWHSVEHAEIDDCSQSYYPHMNKDVGLFLSLNVEATK